MGRIAFERTAAQIGCPGAARLMRPACSASENGRSEPVALRPRIQLDEDVGARPVDFDAGAAAARPAHAPDDLGRGPADPYVARAALVPDMHECDFALIVDRDRTRPGLAKGYVLASDLPAPPGSDLLAGAERSSRTQCGARFVAHDRVPDAIPEQQQGARAAPAGR